MPLDQDRADPTRSTGAGPIDLREAARVHARSRRLSRTLLLVILAAVLLAVAWGIREVLLARAARSRDSGDGSSVRTTAPPTPTPTDGSSKGGGSGGEDTGAGPGDGGSTQRGDSPDGNRADCHVTNPTWYLEGDALVTRGHVVNTGAATAKNVSVEVIVRGTDGEVVARRKGPTVPPDVGPGHSARFTISIPLPALIAQPELEATAHWD